jgi:hypothetical protein
MNVRRILLWTCPIAVAAALLLVYRWEVVSDRIVIVPESSRKMSSTIASLQFAGIGIQWPMSLAEFRATNPGLVLGYANLTAPSASDGKIHALGMYVNLRQSAIFGESAVLGPPHCLFGASYYPDRLPTHITPDDLQLTGVRFWFDADWDDENTDKPSSGPRKHHDNDYQRVMLYLISKIGFPANYDQYGELLFASSPWWKRPLFRVQGRYRYYSWCWSEETDGKQCLPLVEVVYDTQERRGVLLRMSHELYAYLGDASHVPAENLLWAYLSRRMDEVPGPDPVVSKLGPTNYEAARRFPILTRAVEN